MFDLPSTSIDSLVTILTIHTEDEVMDEGREELGTERPIYEVVAEQPVVDSRDKVIKRSLAVGKWQH